MIRPSLLCCALLVLVACADEEKKMSLPCDVRERACQRAVFEATKGARDHREARLPPIRVITRAQLADELRASLADAALRRDPEAELRSRQDQLAMSLLGLMPPPAEQSYDDAYVDQAVISIAAYYSTQTADITIIADQVDDPDTGTLTLSHELLHALQDQREDLERWRGALVHSTDEYVATKSLTEGEATWLSYVMMYDQVDGVEPARIDRQQLFGDMLDGMLGFIDDQSGAPFIAATEMLPYPMGGALVADRYARGGNRAIADLYETPLLALRQFAAPPFEGLPEPLDCDVPEPPAEYEELSTDRLGFAGLVALQVALGEPASRAYRNAVDWRADRLAVYARPGDPDAAAIAWRLRLGSPEAASALSDAINLARLGEARPVGSELLISAVSKEEDRAAWQPYESCRPATKSRGGRHTPRLSLDDVLGIVR